MGKWDERFLKLALEVSTWSKDPSTKVGAVIAARNRLVSVGFNGFPPSVPDLKEYLDDRPTKYKLVIHAETNAILNAKGPVDGCTMYTAPLCPCGECAKLVAAAGITRVVSKKSENPRWNPDDARFVFEKSGIKFEIYG